MMRDTKEISVIMFTLIFYARGSNKSVDCLRLGMKVIRMYIKQFFLKKKLKINQKNFSIILSFFRFIYPTRLFAKT